MPQTVHETTATQREQLGQCPRCGQQLYHRGIPSRTAGVKGPRGCAAWGLSLWTKSKGSRRHGVIQTGQHPTWHRREPLTIEGLVQRGHCLRCAGGVGLPGTRDAGLTVGDDESPREEIPMERLLQHDELAARQQDPSSSPVVQQDEYRGDYCQGLRHGHGTLYFASGGEYVGSFAENAMHGAGTRRYANGDVYVGEFFRNQKHSAVAHLYFANGDLYIGPFVHNCMQTVTVSPMSYGETSSWPTTARYYYASGQRFQGGFYNNCRHGRGKLQRLDGSLDIFCYNADARHGSFGLRWNRKRTKVWVVDCGSGNIKRRISVAEAVSLDYELQQEAERLWNLVLHRPNAHGETGDEGPLFGPADSIAGDSVHGMMA